MRKRSVVLVLLYLWLAASCAGAAERVAIVAAQPSDAANAIIDLAEVELTRADSLVILERRQVSRVLREQEISLAHGVNGALAVKAGRILESDLFAVVRPFPGEQQVQAAIVFDGSLGLRLGDGTLPRDIEAAAGSLAKLILDSAEKRRRPSREIKAVSVQPAANSEFPSSYDPWCEGITLLLERALIRSPRILVPERQHLELLHQDDSVVGKTRWRDLVASMLRLGLEFRRGPGRGEVSILVVLRDGAGDVRKTFEVSGRLDDVETLQARLQAAVLRTLALQPAKPIDRTTESHRLVAEGHRQLELEKPDRARALLEAAVALDPRNYAALELLMYATLPPTFIVPENFRKQPEPVRLDAIHRTIRVGEIWDQMRRLKPGRHAFWYPGYNFLKKPRKKPGAWYRCWFSVVEQTMELKALGKPSPAELEAIEQVRRQAMGHIDWMLDRWYQDYGKDGETLEAKQRRSGRRPPFGTFMDLHYSSGYLYRHLGLLAANPEEAWDVQYRFAQLYFERSPHHGIKASWNKQELMQDVKQFLPWPGNARLARADALAQHRRYRDLVQGLRGHEHPVLRAYAEALALEQAVILDGASVAERDAGLETLHAEILEQQDQAPDPAWYPDRWRIDCWDFANTLQETWPTVFPDAAKTDYLAPDHPDSIVKPSPKPKPTPIAVTDELDFPGVRLFELRSIPGAKRVLGWCLEGDSLLGVAQIESEGGNRMQLVEVALDGSPPRAMSVAAAPANLVLQPAPMPIAWKSNEARWMGPNRDPDRAIESDADANRYAAGFPGAGLLWLPRHGGTGRWLGLEDGLTSLDVGGVAVLGDRVIVGVPNRLLSITMPGGHVDVLAAADRLVPKNDLEGRSKFCSRQFVADPERNRLFFQLYSERRAELRAGLYSFQIHTDELQRHFDLDWSRWMFDWVGPGRGETFLLARRATWGKSECLVEFNSATCQSILQQSSRLIWDEGRGFEMDRAKSRISLWETRKPYLIQDGWIWAGRPLQRIRMDGAKREVFRLPVKMDVICGLWHHPNGTGVVLATEQEVFLWRG